ncbi:MAG: AI-2E family transporter, partial [Clostridia bacterium]|nr:AI-2E family transporter [Clostridia bacterium]
LNETLGFISKTVSVFSPVIAAFCIAFVFNVLLVALETKVFRFMDKSKKNFVLKLKRPLCLVLTYLIAFGAIALLILVVIPDIVDTLVYLAEKMPSFIGKLITKVEDLLVRFNINAHLPDLKINYVDLAVEISRMLPGYSSKIVGDAVGITTSVFGGIFDTLFSIVISVYILAQKEKIGRFAKSLIDAFVPERKSKLIYHISSKTYDSFTKFIGGQLIECIILGTLCFIGMSIFGFPNAVIISVLIAVTQMVPIIGATIGVVIGFLLIVITSPIKALLFAAFLLILQQIESNLIYPKVVGKVVGLPGVIVVSSVLLGGNIGGILGALVAVPTSAVVYSLIKEAVDYRMRVKKAKEEFDSEISE